MYRLDIVVVLLVIYLGLSAWAYRDVGVKRTMKAESQPSPAQHTRTHASYWQIALSTVALCIGALLIGSGFGLAVRGLIGRTDWTVFTLGPSFPLNDVAAGVGMLLLGLLVVYETRYAIIKHPRPPKRIKHRPV